MTIICQLTDTISSVSKLMCNKLVRIYDIRPLYDTIDVLIEGMIFPQVGKNSAQVGSEIWTLQLISKNVSAGTAVLKLTISTNPCSGISCPDICVGNDLYYQNCSITYDADNIPIGHECIRGSLKQTNSATCIASTHFIEYDVGFLPQSFLDLVGPNIVAISNEIGRYVSPLVASNIIYKEAKYSSSDKKISIYVRYTTPMSLTTGFSTDFPEYRYYYNELTGRVESLALINSLPAFAGFLAGILIFLKLNVVLKVVGPWGMAIAAIVAVLGAIIVGYTIKDIITGTITPGTVPEPTPADKVKIVEEFVTIYVDPAADDLTPQCKCPTPSVTCTVSDMSFYIGGRATARYAQCIHAHVNKGDATTICAETIRTEIESIKNGLANGTITVQQACTRLENNVVVVVKEEVTKVLEVIDCVTNVGPGYKWNKDTQKCEKVCNFPVMGYCLDTPLTVGAILVGLYVVYEVTKKD